MERHLLTAALLFLSPLAATAAYAPVEGGLGDNLVGILADVSIQVR